MADGVTPPDEGNPVVGGLMGQQAHSPGNPVGQKGSKLILYEKSIIPLASQSSVLCICLPFNPEKSEWENCELNDVNGGDRNNGGGFNLPLLLSITGRNPPELLRETTKRKNN